MMEDLNQFYARINDPSSFENILNTTSFDPRAWSHWFTIYSSKRDGRSIKQMRILIMQGTLRAIEMGGYSLLDGRDVALIDKKIVSEYVRQTTFYASTPKAGPPKKGFENTKIEAILCDCLEAALILKGSGLNPVVLNMASRSHPGGGFMTGQGAQEENLFRRSNYYQSLQDPERIDSNRKWRYPIPEFGGIYSPNVVVFRGSEKNGYDFLPIPTTLSFIAVAAYVQPELHKNRNGEFMMSPSFAEKTKRKIQTILSIAVLQSHNSIVLGALGCGAFQNPPNHIARLFQEVLNDFQGYFQHVVFAIIDDHNSKKAHNPKGNFLPFFEIFGNEGEESIFKVKSEGSGSSSKKTQTSDFGSSSSSSKISTHFTTESDCILFSIDHPKYSGFDNSSKHEIEIEGKKWPTVEHYLHAMRFLLPHHQTEICRLKEPSLCVNLVNHPSTKSWPKKPDYNENMSSILETALIAKFTQHTDIQNTLLETKGSQLVFQNYDLFWGINVNTNKGENNMGKVLMKVRDALLEQTS